MSEALEANGLPAQPFPRRPVLHGPAGTVVVVATLDRAGQPTYHGVWLSRSGSRWLGDHPPASLIVTSHQLDGTTAELVNLLQAAALSYLERLEDLAERLDAVEAHAEGATLAEIASLHRQYRRAREHVGRLGIAVSELSGPLGERFPKLEDVLPQIESELDHLEEFSSWLGQGVRDVLSLRNAAVANRLSAATNRLGEVSNQIAAFANTSNIRMLGVAYIALLLGLVSAVVLIPNTAATILGMPSAAWVPGLWVDAILVVLAVVPLVVVFSRPWVRRVLAAFHESESRTAEGLADLPEVDLGEVHRPSEERLLEDRP